MNNPVDLTRMKYMQADFAKIKAKSEELTEVRQKVGNVIYQQATAEQQRQKVKTGGAEKEQAGATGDGLLIPRIARLSNPVAIVLNWLAFACIGFEGDSNN